MSLEKIQFKKIKKIHGHYIERAHIDNTTIQFMINDLSIQKTLYKKTKKIMLDVSMEKDNQRIRRLTKLKNYTINKVCKQHEATFEVMEKNYINYSVVNEDSITMSLEIHPECQFTKINSYDIKTEDSYKNLTIDDTVDVLVSFKGILYGKSNFTNKYVIHKVIRHEIEEELKLEELNIDIDSEPEDEDDEEVYRTKYMNRFSDFYPTTEEEIVIPVVEKTEEIVVEVTQEEKPEEIKVDDTQEETIVENETESIAETQQIV